MIEQEFDVLWTKQFQFNPALFNEAARAELKDTLLYQRPLKPVKPGRCTFMPDQERAPLALPSTQRFRMYQEVNNLRILRNGLKEDPLTLKMRDDLINALEKSSKRTFPQIKTLLGLGGAIKFNLEDAKRAELKGNATSAVLGKKEHFGPAWVDFDETKQDAIVWQLMKEGNETRLVRWLQNETGVDEKQAEAIVNASLPEGYGSLCVDALGRILPELRRDVCMTRPYKRFDHHSNLSPSATGEILRNYLTTVNYCSVVGFGGGNPQDSDEKRYGRIHRQPHRPHWPEPGARGSQRPDQTLWPPRPKSLSRWPATSTKQETA